MSTDLISLWGAIQRGDMHAVASHIFPKSPSSSDGQHGRKSALSGAQQELSEDGPHAGIGTADAGSSPIRFWTVRFERGGRSHYDRVEAPNVSTAAIVALARNAGSVCAETVCEITRAEHDRFTRRSP